MFNVLLIDDTVPVLQTLEMAFLRKAFHVTTAQDGQEGLEKLNEAFDVICVDFNMPRMNGYDFCFNLKHHPELSQYSHIPIIGIGDFPIDKREYLCNCFPKPFDIEMLFQTINNLHFNGNYK